MQNTPVYTPEFGYAGFIRRATALTLDGIIIVIISTILSPFVAKSQASLAGSLVGIVYLFYFWLYQNGQTLGKKALGIRIVKEDGQPLDFPAALIRWIGTYISALFLSLGYIWMLFNPKKQTWHDILAHTLVVKTDNSSRAGVVLLVNLVGVLVMVGFFLLFFSVIMASLFVKQNFAPSLKTSPSQLKEFSYSGSFYEQYLPQHINRTRDDQGYQPITEDGVLCAFAQKRLQQLTQLGRLDDGKGFYEAVNDPQTSRTYFSKYKTASEQSYRLSKNTTTLNQIADAWSGGVVFDPGSHFGCIRSDGNFVVAIVGK